MEMLFVARSGRPELSLVEQQRWAADRLEPGGHHNLALAMRHRGPLVARDVDRALQALARTHESLRAAFPGFGGKPRVHVEDNAVREISFVDVEGRAWGDAEVAQRIA